MIELVISGIATIITINSISGSPLMLYIYIYIYILLIRSKYPTCSCIQPVRCEYLEEVETNFRLKLCVHLCTHRTINNQSMNYMKNT